MCPFTSVRPDELLQRTPISLCTVATALLGERDGRATAEIICAGHPRAVLACDGKARFLGCHGPLLGAYAGVSWKRVHTEIPPGATLVLYTDGVLDSIGVGRERFGERRLANALAGAAGAQDAVIRVDHSLQAFRVGEQADDTAVLAIQRTKP
jgi:serine phosphatase RsbU (regulator of sigma subunit)